MKSARVLVVADEPPVIEIVPRALAQRGHQGTGTGSVAAGAAALIDALVDES
ncbi:MAG: hypothetical protein AAB268_14055 [Elusimicrobiota bacterium]